MKRSLWYWIPVLVVMIMALPACNQQQPTPSKSSLRSIAEETVRQYELEQLRLKPPPWRVSLDVSADPKLVETYLAQGLSQLKDVVLVTSKPHYTITVVGIETHNKAGDRTGYALSCVFESYVPSCPTIVHHFILVGGDDLQNLCKNVVTRFDAKVMASER